MIIYKCISDESYPKNDRKCEKDMIVYDILFKGEPYILLTNKNELVGPIATEEQYENYEESFAYLEVDGFVWQHRVVIGSLSDIDVIGLSPKYK